MIDSTENTELNTKLDTIEHTKILTSNRKKSRKLLFQELYAMSMNDFDIELFKESFFDSVFSFNQDEEYIEEMKKVITFNESFFINILKLYTPKFKVENMSLSYILPIYIGLGEMFFLTEEIPGKVSINEAVEIAKVYWDDSSKKIVNWVLNKVFKNYDELEKTKNDDYSEIIWSCFKK